MVPFKSPQSSNESADNREKNLQSDLDNFVFFANC